MADERTEKQKVQEITDKLEEGLKELFESERYKTYLSTMSKFHNYSFNNTLLIAMQKPEATLVAGYKAWQKNFERHVNKGEKAIRILAPAPYKIKEERDKLDPATGEMMFDENGIPQKEQVEVTIPAFRAVSVFGVSQTDGKPIPELEAQELLSTVEGYIEAEMKIDGKMLRMDSMMISSSCKKLSRIELVYTVNFNLIKFLNKVESSLVPDELKCYLEEGHKNETIYRTRDKDTTTKLEWLLSHILLLQQVCSKCNEQVTQSEPYKLLIRLLEEQVETNEKGKIVPKDGKELHSEVLQNPSDPDATYREKYGSNIGYVGNIVESFNEESGVITQYDFKPNTYADTKFCEDVLDKLENSEGVNILVDGAYYSYELSEKAKKQGSNLKPSQIVGKEPDESKIPYSEFKVDEETGKITECPNQEKPQVSYSSKDSYTAKFKTEQCENCPKKEKCATKQEKKGYSVRISKKGYSNSKIRQVRHTKEYTKLTNKRSGVEGIPSVIRRKYHVDAMPVRGLLRSKIEFGFKIGAYNFNKLLKYLKKKGIFLAFIRFMRMGHTIIGKRIREDNQYTKMVHLTF